MKTARIILSIIRILLGCTFLLSTILKLISIQNFELYVYSFGLMNYVVTTFAVRFIILCELLLGVALICRIFYRKTWWLTLVMLAGFTLFLTYAAFFRNDTNCHCFGDLIELNAGWSIVKNLVLIALLVIVRKQDEMNHKIKPYVITISALSAIFVTFLGVPPDALYKKIFTDASQERFNPDIFSQAMNIPEFRNLIDSTQNEIIGFVSATCSHCKSGNKKMKAIIEQNNIDHAQFKNAIWAKNDSLITVFKNETNTQDFEYQNLTQQIHIMIAITNGTFPTYLFFEKGTMRKALDYKDLEESDIREFLGKE